MTTEELLIKIKTALEAGGIDAAKQKVAELSQAVKDESASKAASTLAQEKLNKGWSDAARVAGVARTSLSNLNTVGNGLHTIAMVLAGSFTKLVPWISALSIAVNVAMAIRSLVGMLGETDKEAKKAARSAEELCKGLQELEKAKLEKLYDAIDGVTERFDRAVVAAQRVYEQTERLEDAKLAAEIAGIQASDLPEGEKKKKIADLRAKRGEASLAGEAKVLENTVNVSSDKVASLEGQMASLTADRDRKASILKDALKQFVDAGLITEKDASRGNFRPAYKGIQAKAQLLRDQELEHLVVGAKPESAESRSSREAETRQINRLQLLLDAMPGISSAAKAATEVFTEKQPDILRKIEDATSEGQEAAGKIQALPYRQTTIEKTQTAAHSEIQREEAKAKAEREKEDLQKELDALKKAQSGGFAGQRSTVAKERSDYDRARSDLEAFDLKNKGRLGGRFDREKLRKVLEEQADDVNAAMETFESMQKTTASRIDAIVTRIKDLEGQMKNLPL